MHCCSCVGRNTFVSLPCRKFKQVMKHTQVPMYHRHKQSNESHARMKCASDLTSWTEKEPVVDDIKTLLSALSMANVNNARLSWKRKHKTQIKSLITCTLWFVSAMGNRMCGVYLFLPSRRISDYLALFANSTGHATKKVAHGKPGIH